ncbi:MAG: HAMP domain-containing histidine kinase [Ruminococcus sp.]|nr:HAMP domain-containing histidine kinase [Ruminococcus sp.]
MFKKAQLKVFAIITGILILLFIVVLGSINLIMRSVMQKQSVKILEQIAAGVEYDDKTSTFVFMSSEDFNDKKHDFHYDPPLTTASTTTSATTSTTVTTVTSIVTTKTTATVSYSPATTVTTTSTTVTSAAATTSVPTTVTTTTTAFYIPPVTSQPYEPHPKPPSEGGEENPWEQWYPWYPWNPWNPWNPWTDNGQQDSSQPKVEQQRPVDDVPDAEKNQDNPSDVITDEKPSAEELYGSPEQLGNVLRDPSEPPPPLPDEPRRDNDPPPEGEPVPKAIGSIDFFVVMADKAGQYLSVLNNNELAADTAQNYIDAIIKEDDSSGMLSSLQYCRLEKDNGTLIVFTDKSAEIDMLNKLYRTTVTIGIVSLLFLSVAAYFLSRKIIEPLKTAFNKQKQFISDASHELKTPLTVISANADVLSGEIGDNKWLAYIRSQADRMNVLVNDLLNLTRLENNSSDFVRKDFDLSKAVVSTALPFECQAYESSKKFDVSIEKNIMINGSEKHIKQMIAIFIDNALKYSDKGGIIRVSLKKMGDKRMLSVYNTGSGISVADKDRIFERFYRSDLSRNRSTGGYGLGLAIAKSIIDKHKFRIQVDTNPGQSVCFTVIM